MQRSRRMGSVREEVRSLGRARFDGHVGPVQRRVARVKVFLGISAAIALGGRRSEVRV